jgi:hypothetical protein
LTFQEFGTFGSHEHLYAAVHPVSFAAAVKSVNGYLKLLFGYCLTSSLASAMSLSFTSE